MKTRAAYGLVLSLLCAPLAGAADLPVARVLPEAAELSDVFAWPAIAEHR
jgi:hypothetical protein